MGKVGKDGVRLGLKGKEGLDFGDDGKVIVRKGSV